MSIVRIASSDQHLPPAAVIVTIYSGSSYDDLYTLHPQISPDASRCIAVYRTNYASLPEILRALEQRGDCDNAVLRSLVADIISVSSESPGGVVFNFECCSDAGSHGFTRRQCCDLRGSIMQTVKQALDRGFMVIFGDFSLKALIKDWDQSLLGPLPFKQVGEVSGTVRLHFNREDLIECPSSQLQCVGQLCGDNFAGVHAVGGTIQFTVKHKWVATDVYQLQILTVAEAPADYRGPRVKVGKYTGTAGHVLLRYQSGGMLLVSATHWIELTNVNADESVVAHVLMERQGKFASERFKKELESCQNAEERTAFCSRSAVALVQCSPASAPRKTNSK
jgi:hypothetical protein